MSSWRGHARKFFATLTVAVFVIFTAIVINGEIQAADREGPALSFQAAVDEAQGRVVTDDGGTSNVEHQDLCRKWVCDRYEIDGWIYVTWVDEFGVSHTDREWGVVAVYYDCYFVGPWFEC